MTHARTTRISHPCTDLRVWDPHSLPSFYQCKNPDLDSLCSLLRLSKEREDRAIQQRCRKCMNKEKGDKLRREISQLPTLSRSACRMLWVFLACCNSCVSLAFICAHSWSRAWKVRCCRDSSWNIKGTSISRTADGWQGDTRVGGKPPMGWPCWLKEQETTGSQADHSLNDKHKLFLALVPVIKHRPSEGRGRSLLVDHTETSQLPSHPQY